MYIPVQVIERSFLLKWIAIYQNSGSLRAFLYAIRACATSYSGVTLLDARTYKPQVNHSL